MIKITIIHNGKEYDNLEDVLLDIIISNIIEIAKEEIETNLKPLSNEIEKEGGKIILNIGDIKNGENPFVSTSGFSPELQEKIQLALSE